MSKEKATDAQVPQGMPDGMPQKEVKRFDYADLLIECNQCGHKQTLREGIKDGLQFTLPTTESHEIRLVCEKCNSSLRLFWKESSEEVKQAAEAEYQNYLEEQKKLEAEKESLMEETAKVEKERDDALLQEGTEETPEEGVN